MGRPPEIKIAYTTTTTKYGLVIVEVYRPEQIMAKLLRVPPPSFIKISDNGVNGVAVPDRHGDVLDYDRNRFRCIDCSRLVTGGCTSQERTILRQNGIVCESIPIQGDSKKYHGWLKSRGLLVW